MEEFVDIPGYEGYRVNRLGQVMGLKGYILKPNVSSAGYYRVNCYGSTGLKSCSIHRLIALTFIPNPDNKPEIDHIDRNPLNNCVDNLRWATRIENANNQSFVLPSTGHQYISFYKKRPTSLGVFRVRIRKLNYQKHFKTLPEAIAARDEFLNNNNLS